MDNLLQIIADKIEDNLVEQLNKCGMMFRLFSRVKTVKSLAHKMEIKGDKYRSGKSKIQDMIGLRIVAYFQDDVEALAFYYSYGEVVDSSIDEVGKYYITLKGDSYEDLKAEFVTEFKNCFESYVFNEYRKEIAVLTKELPKSVVNEKLSGMTQLKEYKILHTML